MMFIKIKKLKDILDAAIEKDKDLEDFMMVAQCYKREDYVEIAFVGVVVSDKFKKWVKKNAV